MVNTCLYLFQAKIFNFSIFCQILSISPPFMNMLEWAQSVLKGNLDPLISSVLCRVVRSSTSTWFGNTRQPMLKDVNSVLALLMIKTHHSLLTAVPENVSRHLSGSITLNSQPLSTKQKPTEKSDICGRQLERYAALPFLR